MSPLFPARWKSSPHTSFRRNVMAQRSWVSGLIMLAIAAVGRADDKSANKLAPAVAHMGLERMKTLAGTWLATGKDGKPTDQVVSVVRVTAAGSAVHETLFPGQPHEMISIYYRDGADLMMTHYCALGNQPHMK